MSIIYTVSSLIIYMGSFLQKKRVPGGGTFRKSCNLISQGELSFAGKNITCGITAARLSFFHRLLTIT